MHGSTAKLIQAADLLEKVAAYLDAEEQEENAQYAANIHNEYVRPITEAIENVPKGVQAKLANLDPEVLDFFKNVAGARKAENYGYQPMGGAAEKIASDGGDPLLNFCLGDD